MPEVDSRTGARPVDEVLAEFNHRRDHFEELRGTTRQLIETILKQEVITIQSVQARVKKKEKIKSKYCDPEKDYKCLDDILDIVGFRIITYYSDKIDQIAQIIGREFAERGPREDKRKGKPDSFGYSAIHFDCAYSPARSKIAEYKRFASDRFEIQVTTILGHAWAEMQHPWYDESKPPSEEMRRFYRLAAVLELAEQEFLQIRTQKENRERIASVRVEAKAPGIPISADSIKALVEQPHIEEFDRRLADILFGKEAKLVHGNLNLLVKFCLGVGISTVEQLDGKLQGNKEAITEFVARYAPINKLARAGTPPNFIKGLSILYMAYLFHAAKGLEKFQAAMQEAGMRPSQGIDAEKIATAARETAQKYRLV